MKTKVKYLVLGAGPSGLSFAHTLLANGEDSFLVLEREADAGGLCRSQIVDGAPLDIGGGHFLDVKKKDVLDLVFRHMPREEWNLHDRVSKITIRGTEVDHPLEANLWQLPVEAQIDFLESIAQAGCVRGQSMPESFQDWITWKLGDRIAEEYMLPYNRKIWSMDLNRLGTYWLYKLPDVSFRETLQSCLERRATGKLPAHGQFFYPKKFGYGEVWRRMGIALGDRFVPNCPATQIDVESLTVNGQFQGETIVNSIPWTLWPKMAKIPAEVTAEIGKLVNIPIDVDYDPTMQNTPAHWVYDPDEALTHHRRLVRSNFCPGSKGFWTETNANRSGAVKHFRHRNEFAYPVNTLGKPEAVDAIGQWALGRGILPLGRWGTWEHMNSDIATQLGIEAAKKALAKG
jgi:protoporphyrinogen oxidase